MERFVPRRRATAAEYTFPSTAGFRGGAATKLWLAYVLLGSAVLCSVDRLRRPVVAGTKLFFAERQLTAWPQLFLLLYGCLWYGGAHDLLLSAVVMYCCGRRVERRFGTAHYFIAISSVGFMAQLVLFLFYWNCPSWPVAIGPHVHVWLVFAWFLLDVPYVVSGHLSAVPISEHNVPVLVMIHMFAGRPAAWPAAVVGVAAAALYQYDALGYRTAVMLSAQSVGTMARPFAHVWRHWSSLGDRLFAAGERIVLPVGATESMQRAERLERIEQALLLRAMGTVNTREWGAHVAERDRLPFLRRLFGPWPWSAAAGTGGGGGSTPSAAASSSSHSSLLAAGGAAEPDLAEVRRLVDAGLADEATARRALLAAGHNANEAAMLLVDGAPL